MSTRHLRPLPSHVTRLRPMDPQTAQAVTCGHPSVYDASNDDLRPHLPIVVDGALSVLCTHAVAPSEFTRRNAAKAFEAVVMWRAGGRESDGLALSHDAATLLDEINHLWLRLAAVMSAAADDANPHGIARPS